MNHQFKFLAVNILALVEASTLSTGAEIEHSFDLSFLDSHDFGSSGSYSHFYTRPRRGHSYGHHKQPRQNDFDAFLDPILEET